MTLQEAANLIHDKNNGLIEITEEQKVEILKHFTETDMRCMINPPFNYDGCYKKKPIITATINK
jgi:hypothetical protein